ncbi:MAG TPA: alpha/beta hydrolase [Ohtaekwangia sp.]|nr:alpha/beta hydrolase [Ohtaekwangia sp.]
MKLKRLIWYSFPVLFVIVVYFLGPSPEQPQFNKVIPAIPAEPEALERHVAFNDAKHNIKPGNDAEVVWYDSTKARTEYAILYLHGFSASKMEGDPTHRQFARAFGCNLFLSRLSDHGIDTTETLMLFSVDRLWESAKEALAITNQLGEKVIIVGTSTGATIALKLAAEFPDRVHALINLSPNVEINNDAAFLLNDPWGLYIARAVMGGKYRVTGATAEHARYWNKKYRLESLTELQELTEEVNSKALFQRITQPVLTLYYYQDETHQDPEVKVSAMLSMHEQLATPPELKEAVAIPKAGAHVIGSSLTSKDLPSVYSAMENFAIEKLKMNPVDSD